MNTDYCKHCDLPIAPSGATGWVHVNGPQQGKIRCAINPYGYNAAPSYEPCDFTCNGGAATQAG